MEGMENEIWQAANETLHAQVRSLRAERDQLQGKLDMAESHRLHEFNANKRLKETLLFETQAAQAEIERLKARAEEAEAEAKSLAIFRARSIVSLGVNYGYCPEVVAAAQELLDGEPPLDD